MHAGQKWVVQQHARPGIAHHDFYLLAHVWFVAVDGTVGASGLIWAERAALEAGHCVVQQCLALRAQVLQAAVLCPAVQVNHGTHGAFFAQYPSIFFRHLDR
jgi:hypothetical protein